MKKVSSLVFAAAVAVLLAGSAFTVQAKSSKDSDESLPSSSLFKPFNVYTDDNARTNHFAPSGWMGDFSDIRINSAWAQNPHSGKTCIKIVYNSSKMSQNAGWVGIYWQQPMSNWGNKKGGFNLKGASKLTFWAKGAVGGEKINEFKMGGIAGEFPDSDSAAIGPIELSNTWQKYTIDLKDKDLSNVVGGFCWSASKDDNPNGFIFFLDDIIYE